MAPATKFYLVSAEALPEIFIKVAEAKRMLQSGEVRTAGDAARTVGISRSAFYKYRDAVRPFNDMKPGRIITFYTMLKNNPGVLSNVLSIFAGSGANILTINRLRACCKRLWSCASGLRRASSSCCAPRANR